MWTCASILVPRSSSRPPIFWKASFTAMEFPALAASHAVQQSLPGLPTILVQEQTLRKYRPKSMPAGNQRNAAENQNRGAHSWERKVSRFLESTVPG